MSTGLKAITPVYRIVNSQPMTGVAVVTSSPTNITYKDSFAIQLQWTGTPAGIFEIQGSIDYNPGDPQSGGGQNPGVWTPIPVVDQIGNPPAALGAAGQILINMNQLAFPWIRTVYMNSAGVGTLDAYISGKSLG